MFSREVITMPSSKQIIWPAYYQPSNCPIHVRNEIDIAAPAERVCAWLIRAPLWPSWYVNSANVRLLDRISDLALGAVFRWKTFGVSIESVVQEWVPNERIAWTGKAFGLDVYHAWLIEKTAAGCHVLTEETQHGFMVRLGKLFMPNRMSTFHQIWLEGLRDNAMKGLPPR